MHDVAKGFRSCWEREKVFLVGKSRILESQETCGFAWRVFWKGKKDVGDSSNVGKDSPGSLYTESSLS